MDAKNYKEIISLIEDCLENIEKIARQDGLNESPSLSYLNLGIMTADLKRALEIVKNGC